MRTSWWSGICRCLKGVIRGFKDGGENEGFGGNGRSRDCFIRYFRVWKGIDIFVFGWIAGGVWVVYYVRFDGVIWTAIIICLTAISVVIFMVLVIDCYIILILQRYF